MAAAIAEPPHLAADLKALRLSTVAAQWQPLAEQAVRQRQAPADYLAQLVHLEVTARRERRIQRRIQDARFPMLKTLDAFSFEAQPDLDRNAVLQVFDCRFVAEAANVVFVGGVGTGKTHLSIALGMTCCPARLPGAVRDRSCVRRHAATRPRAVLAPVPRSPRRGEHVTRRPHAHAPRGSLESAPDAWVTWRSGDGPRARGVAAVVSPLPPVGRGTSPGPRPWVWSSGGVGGEGVVSSRRPSSQASRRRSAPGESEVSARASGDRAAPRRVGRRRPGSPSRLVV